MTDAQKPFTVDDIKRMREGITLADETEKAINKAKSAGIDTGDQLDRIRDGRAKLVQILRVYDTP